MILRIAAILFFASVASADATDCKTISDPTKRLACFDAPKAAKKPVAADPYASAKIAMSRKLSDPQSAQWGDFYTVVGEGGFGLVCGAVNAENQMGGYVGMTGFTYEPKIDRAIMLFSGRTDGQAGIAYSLYQAYCLDDPRADQRANPNSGYIPQ